MSPPPPSCIILIIMDTVGARRCSAYGHPRQTTPGLGRIAADGVLYERCFAPSSWTMPSHASLFSGLYPGQHGYNTNDLIFPGNYYVLPEILQEMGYYTIGLSSNYVISRATNFSYGFHEFYDIDTLFNNDKFSQARRETRAQKDQYRGDFNKLRLIFKTAIKHRYFSYPLLHLMDRTYRRKLGDCIKHTYVSTERSLYLARKLIKKNRGRKVFLFINFMEAHPSYNPPWPYRHILKKHQHDARRPELLYEQEIAYVDARLFAFYGFLKKHGLDQETLLILTSDHGEAFGEHKHFGHTLTLYNEILHIPLIIKYPAAFSRRGTVPDLVQLHDLFATLLEVAQAPLPAPESSRSLLGPPRDVVLAENLDVTFGLRKAQGPLEPHMQPCRCLITKQLHKLIEWADGRFELFDCAADFQEQRNLIDEPSWSVKAAALKRRLYELLGPFQYSDAHLGSEDVPRSDPAPHISPGLTPRNTP